MKNENLIVYKDVVSAANQTINSLKRVFTLAEYLNEEGYWKYPSFIKAFKEVGFKTYWLTNQPVYGKHESEASFIARENDVFISSTNLEYIDNKNVNKYDKVLLKKYAETLQKKNQKKVIFLHILGVHSAYKNRYPKEFNIFAKEKSKDEKVNLLREYDNAVRYNDSFLYEVLDKLKKQNAETSFIMFSDHGESLYDTPNLYYHGSPNPTKSEVEIPLILWFSEKFKENHKQLVKNVVKNAHQPVLSSDFFHAFPSLFGIRFKKLKLSNNFFGTTYIPKVNRKIVNVNLELKEYDKLSNNHAKINY